jgi:hypothetical protein
MSNHETVDVPVEKEVEVKLDPITDLIQTTVERNISAWQAGYDEGYKAGWKAGSLTSTEPTSRIVSLSEQRDRELLEEQGIDVDGFVADTVKMIEDHEK